MSIIIMLLLLSVLILVHEAGHFIAARYFKIKVDKFGFGLPIGPTLYETKWGDTKILIHAFLLGGYVAFPDDEKDCELSKDSPERFINKPVYQRAIVVSAGVFANILCAFFFVFLTAALWGNLPSGKYEIYVNDIVAPKQESIWQSGLQKKDRIIEINGTKVENTYALLDFIKMSKSYDGKIDANTKTDNYLRLKALNSVFTQDEIIPEGIAVKLPEKTFEAPVKIEQKVLKGMKKHVDKQISLNSKQTKLRDKLIGQTAYISDGTCTLDDLAYAISDNSRPLDIKVLRNGKTINLKTVYANKKGLLGIKLEAKEVLIPTKTPQQVITKGTKYLWDNTYMLLYGLYQIFSGQIPLKDLHGIVAITKVGGDIITNSGIFFGLLLIAIISMDLAIINFLPIPALDGGHIMFLIIEKLRGKPLDEKVIDKIGSVGFAFLITLMVFVIFNDIAGLITKKF
ncbi:MAG TPA: RIP metalloprotease RseP [Candidatus Gastranaerophilaceae bacterium]|nr:RIP metalloprotease RseP [Candidatus Gastranaerophilaceae bacterium]HPT41779.1 RIP metalloprotease RseP [Candidatus Gastranaerophilaceae bacterium]